VRGVVGKKRVKWHGVKGARCQLRCVIAWCNDDNDVRPPTIRNALIQPWVHRKNGVSNRSHERRNLMFARIRVRCGAGEGRRANGRPGKSGELLRVF